MFQSNTKSFGELRQYLDQIPVIETHEHYTNYAEADDALNFVLKNYYNSDFVSAGGDENFTEVAEAETSTGAGEQASNGTGA